MSLKDLFAKKALGTTTVSSFKEVSEETESEQYATAFLKDKNRFIPPVDFSQPSKFVRFGSAEKYYYDSIADIYKTYPYDGSKYEKISWHNSSSNLQNYIFENEYPRTNGYINIGLNYGNEVANSINYSLTDSPEYIFIKGGPNRSSAPTLKEQFVKANKIQPEKNRDYNLYINGNTGLTTEFWLKKNDASGSNKQVIFDLWNSSSFSSTDYGRFRVEIRPGVSGQENKFFIEFMSGTAGIYEVEVGSNLNLTSSEWNHYALNVVNSGTTLKLSLFKDGILNDSLLTGSSISEVTGAYIATIGALITPVSGVYGGLGYGKLSGSIDEFRFWKNKRSDKKISRHWFEQVGGGTNTDDANTDLGLYYKFNEGIYDNTSVSNYDKKILDYSGRISNGNWLGYTLGARSTGSAMVESLVSKAEFKDPIVYSTHPDVVSLLEQKIEIAKEYDSNNNGSIINSFPQWMIEEDREQLLNLGQIVSQYFDELYLKIENLPSIKDNSFKEGKPLPFSGRLLESCGFTSTDLFTDASVIESLLSRNENFNFEEKIHNIKNFIYQNIYNNLVYIYRSKGTEKSIRNLIRCFGVDDSLIKLNAYADGVEYTLQDKVTYTSAKKKYADFNSPDRFNSTVYQYYDPSDSSSLSYIIGNKNLAYLGSTLEFEVLFPKKYESNSDFYFRTDFVSSSLAGMHEANSSSVGDFTWQTPDRAHISIFAVKYNEESPDAYFVLSSSYLNVNISSSLFKDVYNNSKWNFAAKLYHEKYPLSNQLVGTEEGDYILELHAVNTILDSVQNEFKLTASVPQNLALQHFAAAKRIYIGSHHYNFTGSVVIEGTGNSEQYSDVKISSVRYWLHKLSDKSLIEHSKDIESFGADNPDENVDSYILVPSLGSIPFNGNDLRFSKIKSLALHWSFDNVTASDNGSGVGPANTSDGKFTALDLTNGNLDVYLPDNQIYITDDITVVPKIKYNARGDFFLRNNTEVVDREIVQTARKKLPETINDSDLVNILVDDDNVFTRDSQPVNYYFSLEKSMYQIVSQEILKIFGTIESFNNLIGESANRYRQNYPNIERLREIYFENVINDLNFEKFVDFYKWFDDSIGIMIKQLIPASANYSPELKTVIESHILERNKYWNKYPTLQKKLEIDSSPVRGINELQYNWQHGHAPIPLEEDISHIWWKFRAEKIGELNENRKQIFDVVASAFNRKFNQSYNYSIEAVTIVNKNSIRFDYLNNFIKFGSNTYLQIGDYQDEYLQFEEGYVFSSEEDEIITSE